VIPPAVAGQINWRSTVPDEPLGIPSSLDRRVTIVEVELRNLAHRMDVHLADGLRAQASMLDMIRRLDDRADAVDRRFAYIAGALGVSMFLGQVFGPALARLLGLPT